MSNRDALFAVAVLALGLSGAAGMAATGQIVGTAVRAQAMGFDVLADRMFDGKACSTADVQ
ncbi:MULTISPECIES: hypothetical protein [Oxalobacteraceae]|uniref:hypothetical protein n=1 Tax=Oxalobacteraceae TaxID=75682 RepID=UPI0010A41F8E|nr:MULTISPECIES: hypothetical protein [Oxalobacteraceae]